MARGQRLPERAQRAAAESRRSAAMSTPGFAPPITCSRIASRRVRAQRADGTARRVALWEGDKLTVYTPTAASPIAARHGPRPRDAESRRCAWSVSTWAATSANKNQNQDADLIAAILAAEAGAPVKLELLAQGGLHRRARPLADGAVLQGGRQGRRHADVDSTARHQRHGPYRKNSGAIGGIEGLSVSEHRDHVCPGLHQPDGLRETFRGPNSRRGSSASSR
jgi:hypothetical protein